MWLGELVDALEEARHRELRMVVNVPPQVGKTETVLHWIARCCRAEPEKTNGYVSYATDLSRSKSRKARRYAEQAGVTLDQSANRLEEWRTSEGGGLLATGIGGPLTGQAIDGVLVVDDPVKNREEAESRVMRDKQWDWINDVGLTRLHPGASCVVVQTRWHEDDPAGRAIKAGWDLIRIPAVRDPVWDADAREFLSGQPIWPEGGRDLGFYARIRRQIGEYAWASLYDQNPRPRGGALFQSPTYTETLPAHGRYAIGVDLAYTAKTHADYSVAVVLCRDSSGLMTVVDVRRLQVKAPDFAMTLRALSTEYPGAPMRFYASGTEKGSADFMAQGGVPIQALPATADKFVRAQGASAAWNDGQILVPRHASWAPVFVDEVCSFTGVNDPHDDMVDALAAAHDCLKTIDVGLRVQYHKPLQSREARKHF